MTVQTSTTVATGIGNGVTTVFPLGFKFNRDEDLIVNIVDETAQTETLLTLNSDYTVSGAGNENGGSLTLTAGPLPTGKSVVTKRMVNVLQLTDLRNQGKFFAEVHEDAFDQGVMIDQQQQEQLGRSMFFDLLGRWSAFGRRIINLGAPILSGDATRKDYVDAGDQASKDYSDDKDAANFAKTLRTPDSIGQISNAEVRALKILSFDSAGNPLTVAPPFESAADLAIRLGDPLGAENGAAVIGRGVLAVESVSDLLALPSSAKRRDLEYEVKGFYAATNRGGGKFYWDPLSTETHDGILIFETGDPIGRFKRRTDVLIPSHAGIRSIEQGATNPIAEKALWENLRLAAERTKATVWVPSETFVLPENVRLDADNSNWVFLPGSLLKLHDTQVVSADFLVFSSPLRQRVTGLRFDANRAAQNTAIFGEDRSGCLVVDAKECEFKTVTVVSSPAKGFAIVSSAGGSTDDNNFENLSGGDCGEQCILIDGNNGTGSFGLNTMSKVRVGATNHAGLAVNDGAYNWTITDVLCDVQNTRWDAVTVRDCWDLNMTNIRGMRGRSGVSFEKLTLFCGRLTLDGIVGELSDQSGVIFTGVEGVNAGTITGRNNKAVGLNIATSGITRCRDMNIASPQGYDDRDVPEQQYGIVAQGVDVCKLGKHIAYGNTVTDILIVRSETSEVDAEITQITTGTTGEIPAASEAAVSLAFAKPMPDDIYDVEAQVVVGTASRSLIVGHIAAKTATAVQILILNLGTSAATGVLEVKVKRRP